MKPLARLVCIALVGTCLAAGAPALLAQTAPAAPAAAKNWTPPAYKTYAQKLVDETMAAHKDLLSVTLHGVPPGKTEVYTMFAGSYPDRVGNPDDPDDIDVIKKGITILDPRWKRVKDTDKKFVVLMPMRDAKSENVGLVVYAFKNPPKMTDMEQHYLAESIKLRDALAKKIKTYDGLFEQVK